MTRNFAPVADVIQAGLDRTFPAAQVAVWHRGDLVFTQAAGWLDPDTRTRPATLETAFDLASVTKLYVVTTFMTLVEAGRAGLDQPVAQVLPDFSGQRSIQPYEDPLHPGALVTVQPQADGAVVQADQITFRQLLTHTAGLPAWRPLFRAGDAQAARPWRPLFRAGDAQAARRMALTTPFACTPGARILYSDIGLILLGMGVEALTGQRLDRAVQERVLAPLGLTRTGFRPLDAGNPPPDPTRNVAPTELCAWRGRRVVDEVHDENAAGLGGIAGHAGLFSTAQEVAIFGQSFLDALTAPRPRRPLPILSQATVSEMVRPQAEDGGVRRGLGFALWSPDPEASGNPFSAGAFGHTGFTGTSLWIDPERQVVVACLTNRVYFGRDAGEILAFRVALHRAVLAALE